MRNSKIFMVSGIACFIIAAVFIYINTVYLPSEKKKMMESFNKDYQEVGVWYVDNENGLYKDTTISEALFKENTIKLKKVPKKYLPNYGKGVYTEHQKGALIDKVSKRSLVKGEFLLRNDFEDKVFSDDEQLKRRKEYTLHNTVAGEIKTGSYVDIIVDYRNGDYDIVVPKIKIDRVVEKNDKEKKTELNTAQVVLSVDENEFRDLELANKMGIFIGRVYKSEDQYPSMATFKYDVVVKTVKEIAREQFLTGDISSYLDSKYVGFMGDKSTLKDKALRNAKELIRRQQLQADLDAKKEIEVNKPVPQVQPPVVQPEVPVQPVVPEQPQNNGNQGLNVQQ